MLCAALALPAAACTRTYDGTLVPAYELVPAAGRSHGWYQMKPADPLPPDRLYKFPPPPPPPPQADGRVERPPPRRGHSRLIPKLEERAPKPVTCTNQTVEGRVRVVCL
jgi:hypothetical protein